MDDLMGSFGLKPTGRTRAPAASTARPVASPARTSTPLASQTSAVVTRDPASGTLTYMGYPVAMAGGEPCVFACGDWMKVSVFEATGLTKDDLSAAQATVAMGGPAAHKFRQGPA